jgi:hypothetical protein
MALFLTLPDEGAPTQMDDQGTTIVAT